MNTDNDSYRLFCNFDDHKMENVTPQEKKNLATKLREFQINGLESYGKYLATELERSQSDLKQHYRKYIENEIERNNKKMEEVRAKL